MPEQGVAVIGRPRRQAQEGDDVVFRDRADAGRRLAARLGHLHGSCVVVALPRGGVPVAAEVAAALEVPLDVVVVRKLGVPFQPELGLGAIGERGVRVLNDDVVRHAHTSDAEIAAIEARERIELDRRVLRYRGPRAAVEVEGRTVVVVDDGIATGSTARAACQVVRSLGATRVVLAVPVAPAGWATTLADVADELVCVSSPRWFNAVGSWYRDFAQTSDDEVVALLDATARRSARTDPPPSPPSPPSSTSPPS